MKVDLPHPVTSTSDQVPSYGVWIIMSPRLEKDSAYILL